VQCSIFFYLKEEKHGQKRKEPAKRGKNERIKTNFLQFILKFERNLLISWRKNP
jgi:hypothetical protein